MQQRYLIGVRQPAHLEASLLLTSPVNRSSPSMVSTADRTAAAAAAAAVEAA